MLAELRQSLCHAKLFLQSLLSDFKLKLDGRTCHGGGEDISRSTLAQRCTHAQGVHRDLLDVPAVRRWAGAAWVARQGHPCQGLAA